MATDGAVHDAIRLSPMFPLKSTPKNNILLPLNRFRTPYQNPLQQCTPYHTLYTPPSNILYFPLQLPLPVNYYQAYLCTSAAARARAAGNGGRRREKRETERETMEGPGSVEGDRTTSKCAGSDIGYRWSGYRVIPPSIFRAPGRFQCTVVHSLKADRSFWTRQRTLLKRGTRI